MRGLWVQELEAQKGDPRLYAGRYQLFVAWSPDRSHPWDALPGAERAAAVLEDGGTPDDSGKARRLPGRPARTAPGRCLDPSLVSARRAGRS